MAIDRNKPQKPAGGSIDTDKLDKIVSTARRAREDRQQGYREQSLRLHPWVCGRCGREFSRENLHELTVHHKDHNHDNNPPDGSNWENLCLYCHDYEHQKYEQYAQHGNAGEEKTAQTTFNPFADLKSLMDKK
jgi:hypothetical protein